VEILAHDARVEVLRDLMRDRNSITTLADALKFYRWRGGFSIEGLAERTVRVNLDYSPRGRVSAATIEGIENGTNTTPQEKTLKVLGMALGLDNVETRYLLSLKDGAALETQVPERLKFLKAHYAKLIGEPVESLGPVIDYYRDMLGLLPWELRSRVSIKAQETLTRLKKGDSKTTYGMIATEIATALELEGDERRRFIDLALMLKSMHRASGVKQRR